VTLPPGRARLVTSPVATGSITPAMTIGMVAVACFAAWIAGGAYVTMMSTFRRTSSVARPGRRSYLPSAHRDSIAMF